MSCRENACPPDDCGGIDGYYEMLKSLADPNHPEHEETNEWMGGEWDAARFDIDRVNAALKRYKR
ncbi:MAG: IS1096 element passenger TnpR family protein [Opitutaceae bacterium]